MGGIHGKVKYILIYSCTSCSLVKIPESRAWTMVERSALSRSIGNFDAVMVVNVCECVSDGLPGDVSS